jgi:GT2 family glycosyltransferase
LNRPNPGFAKSSNIGASRAKGEYLCFLNNDVVLKPGWLEPMYELARSAPDIGVVGNIQTEPGSGLIGSSERKRITSHGQEARSRNPGDTGQR